MRTAFLYMKQTIDCNKAMSLVLQLMYPGNCTANHL